jgi:hypothetical protein
MSILVKHLYRLGPSIWMLDSDNSCYLVTGAGTRLCRRGEYSSRSRMHIVVQENRRCDLPSNE